MRALLLPLLLLTLLPSVTADEDPWKTVTGLVEFSGDPETGIRRAEFTGRPLMYFFALKDGPCSRRMGETVFRNPATVTTVATRFIPVLVDAADAVDFAKAHRLRGTPQTVLVNLEGKAVRTIRGAVTVKRFRREMNEALAVLGKPKPSAEYLRYAALTKKVEKSLSEERFRDAVKEAEEILECEIECEFTVRARAIQRVLEGKASSLLRKAKRLIAEEHAMAAGQLLNSIPERFPGLPASREAEALLSRLRKRLSRDQ